MELEDVNYSRKLPMDLGDSAENFYNLSRDITKEFLFKMMRETTTPTEKVKSKFEENKEFEEEFPLPELSLGNSGSHNEFDRLGLKKEQSENCPKNHKE